MKKSRKQILDNLAYKWSRNNPDCIEVDTFEEWLLYYDSQATLRLVYIAMSDYIKDYIKREKNYQEGILSEDVDDSLSVPLKAFEKWVDSLDDLEYSLNYRFWVKEEMQDFLNNYNNK